MRGRKPIPSKIIDIRGGSDLTHRPPRDGEPHPPANIPKCPKHLDKEAKQEWRRMVKELEPLGMLTNLDKAIFALYCESYSIWAKSARIIQEKGMVFSAITRTVQKQDGSIVTTGSGLPSLNPYFKIADKAKEQMIKALTEMGMTPSSRARVKVAEPKPKSQSEKERFFK